MFEFLKKKLAPKQKRTRRVFGRVRVPAQDSGGQFITFEMGPQGITIKEPGRPVKTVPLGKVLDLAREQFRLPI